MVDSFFREVEEKFARGIEFIPVVVMNRTELEREMIRAVEINPHMSDAQKMHAIDNIIKYALADVAWMSPEYQRYRLGKFIEIGLAGKPPDEIAKTKSVLERSYSEKRLDTVLKMFSRPILKDIGIYGLFRKFMIPDDIIRQEVDALINIGFLEEVEGKVVLTLKGKTYLEGLV